MDAKKVAAMKMDPHVWFFSVVTMAFLCCFMPPSHAEDQSSSSSRQQLIAIMNLEKESSANSVSKEQEAVVFQGNELVDSAAKQLSATGTLPPNSTLALPTNSKSMNLDDNTTSTPMDLVERDLQKSQGVELNALMKGSTIIGRNSIGVPLSGTTNISSAPNYDVGTGGSKGKNNIGTGVGIARK